MPWWALIPVVSMITGPVVLYVLSRRKRDSADSDEARYEELSHKYDELLAENRRLEPPAAGDQRG
ncbi:MULTISPECIES: hypothetical protein [Streptomyces]|uniref:hypothetical protein n=1 Tax=Streptomyces TaxID=1883 RepID=UPI001C2EBCF4|nr:MULTISPECIES: hypothetical protein [Streptomyces]MBV1946918.1 hypothetical protein [Streptomyces sp. BV129]BDH05984.1 hypothetical protein HEK131_32110 [Streptomyces seoulensis]